jgi:hypothetical protein
MAYNGTAFVNPGTSDLVRLIIRTGQAPAETGACELSQVLDYGRVGIDGREFLLPKEVQASVIHTDRSEAENRIRYSASQEFHSESTIRFEQAPAGVTLAPERDETIARLAVPTGLPLKVVFTNRHLHCECGCRRRDQRQSEDRYLRPLRQSHCSRECSRDGTNSQNQAFLRISTRPHWRTTDNVQPATVLDDRRQAGNFRFWRNRPSPQGPF